MSFRLCVRSSPRPSLALHRVWSFSCLQCCCHFSPRMILHGTVCCLCVRCVLFSACVFSCAFVFAEMARKASVRRKQLRRPAQPSTAGTLGSAEEHNAKTAKSTPRATDSRIDIAQRSAAHTRTRTDRRTAHPPLRCPPALYSLPAAEGEERRTARPSDCDRMSPMMHGSVNTHTHDAHAIVIAR